jgi:hypothetical protein
MAGDWLPIRLDLRDDLAVIVMADELKLDPDTVVGKLHRLWSWANKNTRDGYVRGITLGWIDRYVEATGFALAMVHARWLDVNDDGAEFPNFDRWNGGGAKERLQDTVRKRHARTSPESVRKMSASQPDKNRTTEQKRREQKRENDLGCAPSKTPIDTPLLKISAEHVADAAKVADVLKPRQPADYLLIARAVLLKFKISENGLWDSVEGVKRTGGSYNPFAYFTRLVANRLPDFTLLGRALPIDDEVLAELFPDAPFAQPAPSLLERVEAELRAAGDRGLTDEQLLDAFCSRGDVHKEGTLRARRVELCDAGLAVDSGRTRKTRADSTAKVWIHVAHHKPPGATATAKAQSRKEAPDPSETHPIATPSVPSAKSADATDRPETLPIAGGKTRPRPEPPTLIPPPAGEDRVAFQPCRKCGSSVWRASPSNDPNVKGRRVACAGCGLWIGNEPAGPHAA